MGHKKKGGKHKKREGIVIKIRGAEAKNVDGIIFLKQGKTYENEIERHINFFQVDLNNQSKDNKIVPETEESNS